MSDYPAGMTLRPIESWPHPMTKARKRSPFSATLGTTLGPPKVTPGITARCQDCTRAWNLTGAVLQQAVQVHEDKHSHIVDIFTGAAP